MADERELGIVLFNGVRYPCEPYVGGANVALWEQKVVDGDYTRDSDKTMSAKIWTTFAGGIGVLNHREGADEGRCWFALADIERPYQIALPPRVDTHSSIKYPLGVVGDTFYASDNSGNVYSWSETTETFTDTTANLSDVPAFRGTAWNGKLYIPAGADGYTIYTPPTTVSAQTRKCIDFIVWDSRIFSLTSDGKLGYASTSPATDSDWTDVATLDSSITPKKLEIYFDRADNEIIYVSTSVGLFAYDPTGLKFVRTQMKLPPHPDNGIGLQQWRSGEDLFYSAGLQVYRYTGAATVPAGPDRSEGLPNNLRGKIVDLAAEHNSLLALMEGLTITTEGSPGVEFDPGSGAEEELEAASNRVKPALLAWTGSGWVPRWVPNGFGGSPNWMYVAATTTCYRLFWGWDGNLYSMRLSRPFSNVRQLFETGEGRFQSLGYVDTGWIDHNMREFDKLASHLEINMEHATEDEYVQIEYQKDFWTDWVVLDTLAVDRGKTIIPFGIETMSDGTLFSRGLSYRRIRFRINFFRGSDSTQTPILDSLVLKHIRLPLTGKTFTITIPLEELGERGFENRSIDQIKEEIDALVSGDEFVRFQHGYEEGTNYSHRVRISRLSGPDKTGLKTAGNRSLSVIVLPLEGYDGNPD